MAATASIIIRLVWGEETTDRAGWNRTILTVVLDEQFRIQRVRHTPDFSTVRSVAELDARPNPWLWQRNVHEGGAPTGFRC